MVKAAHGETVLDPALHGTGGFLTAVGVEHLKASASTVAEREAIAHNSCAAGNTNTCPTCWPNTNLYPARHHQPPGIQFLVDSLRKRPPPRCEYTRKDFG